MKMKGNFETVSDIQRESQAVFDSIKENDFHAPSEVWRKRWDHYMFRPLQVKYYYITYLEKANDITTDPLFHNLSLIIHFTIHTMAE
jgi:hypothetical protein